MNIIEVNHLCKNYKVYEHKSGFAASLKSFFNPTVKTVEAVKDLSFTIKEGELVGFIGENGAGKSTAIKMMTGVLYPSSGDVRVQNNIPYKSRKENAMNIGVIFGQKSRLDWDLSMQDNFRLYKEIYRIDSVRFQRNVDRSIDMLDLAELTKTPIRQMSLGQRMRVEFAMTMLHSPKILFFDEPTIGLDVLAKKNIRDFILEQNRENNTTTLLTSHDMKDLDVVCSRIIMITKGKLFFDGSTKQFKEQYAGLRMAEISFEDTTPHLTALKALPVKTTLSRNKLILQYWEKEISLPVIIEALSASNRLEHIETKDIDIEDIVRQLYLDMNDHGAAAPHKEAEG